MARTTPARSRQHSTASALSPPTFSNQQEPTPTYYQEVTQQDAENYVPSLVAKRLFDEELTQRDFFDSVYSKRSRVRTTTTDSVQRDVPVIDKTTDFSHLSRDQKNRELMLHLFVEQDSELNTQNFVGLIRDKVEPNTLLVNLILDEQEHTLLHWAASCGRIEIVRLLVHHGVKVNIPAKGGVTPLMKAIESNRNYANQSMDELLTMLGPSLFTADESGRTALHHAAALSRYRSKRAMSSYYMQCIARYIEDTRSATNSPTIAFVDTADNSQDTALHIACRYRNHKCVMLLLQLGASKDLKNNNEETAQDLCKYDYRLLRLMQIEENIEPTVYDDFDDVPTTPISDMTESEAESVQEHILQRKISCSTIGSISGMEPFSRVVDSQISKTCKYFGNAKSEVQELKYYRDRFDLIRKHTAKIGKTVGVNVGTTITEEDPNVKRIKLEKPMSQKQVLAETKLSSQLIRLDSLVKSSLEEQGELLAKLDGLSKERSRKEERYQELLGMVCHVPPQMVDEVLTKVIE